MCLQGTTCVMNTCVFRFRRACRTKYGFKFILPALIGGATCVLIATGGLRKYEIDIVLVRDNEFRKGAVYALVSGLVLAKVSRIS